MLNLKLCHVNLFGLLVVNLTWSRNRSLAIAVRVRILNRAKPIRS